MTEDPPGDAEATEEGDRGDEEAAGGG